MKLVLNSLILIAALTLIAIQQHTPVISDYTYEIIGILIVAYVVISFFRSKTSTEKLNFTGGLDVFMLTIIIMLLVISTNGLYSPLFFLLYFLGFGITFIFEPATVFVMAIGMILIFLPDVLKNNAFESYIRLASLLLISPLAYFFGREYKNRSESKFAAQKISKDAKDILQKNASLPQEEKSKLRDIVEQSKKLD